ncbi:hypothetical protein [Neomoorella thermoacetica]|uniref:hypothetical protein n=1 Tax=Neomoorella thermoacetica TaxID=1525 RepID=UPI0012DB266A|nr:hypothetical protein [Moorella thermoacetica]
MAVIINLILEIKWPKSCFEILKQMIKDRTESEIYRNRWQLEIFPLKLFLAARRSECGV